MSQKSRILKHFAPFLALVLFGAALWGLHHVLGSYNYQDIVHQLRSIPIGKISLALILTVASYVVMTAYDGLSIAYIQHHLKRGKVMLASFISYSFSNNIGLSILTSGSIRYRLYTAWGFSIGEITKVITFTTVTFWLGIVTVGGIVFLTVPLAIPAIAHLPLTTAQPLGLLLLSVIALYLIIIFRHRAPFQFKSLKLDLPTPRLALAQLLVGSLDWVMAGSVLYVLLPTTAQISFGQLIGIFLLAQVVALISHVPGGVGVFESLVLFCAPSIAPDALIGSLLVYRGIYYLLPLIVGSLLMAANELLQKRQQVATTARTIARLGSSLIPQLLALEALIAGAVLLFSGAVPTDPGRLHWLEDFVPLPMMEISHFLGSLAGAGLLLLALGLQRRLDVAYLLTTTLLAVGSLLSLLKGVDFEESTLLILMLAALLPCRRYFYRKASLLGERFSSGWIITILLVMGCSVWVGLFIYKDVSYSNELWWHFALKGDAPRFLRATIGAAIMLSIFAIAKLLRPVTLTPALPDADALEKAREIVGSSSDTAANLAMLGDKTLLFNEQRTAFVMYGVSGRSWISMGDPVGLQEEQRELAWKFRELCERSGGRPVFYEIGPESLHIYLDMGMTLLKLGEEARVPLGEFSLEGRSRKGLRYTHRRLTKDGCSFEIVPAEQIKDLLPELKNVSDSWLVEKHTREKGFSLGFFDPDYLQCNPVALVRNQGKIIAFANLWTTNSKEELSIDLMRFLPEAPSGVMDYLFTSLMLWGAEQNYNWFNLGMAPLSGLENRPFAPLWNRIGAIAFRHGEYFYNFHGLRDYKNKFNPVWEPRYLASPGGVTLPQTLTNITALISGGLKGAISK